LLEKLLTRAKDMIAIDDSVLEFNSYRQGFLDGLTAMGAEIDIINHIKEQFMQTFEEKLGIKEELKTRFPKVIIEEKKHGKRGIVGRSVQ
jgi:hypothetical protein